MRAIIRRISIIFKKIFFLLLLRLVIFKRAIESMRLKSALNEGMCFRYSISSVIDRWYPEPEEEESINQFGWLKDSFIHHTSGLRM